MHHPVLLQEAIEALVTNPGGFYVDGTFGRGGHSRALLGRLGPGGHVLGIDKDPAAASVAAQLVDEDGRFSFCQGSFAELPARLAEREVTAVDGILLDLGVSSPQLDEAERGFSFSQDGPLDMRMDTSRGQTAAEWLATADEADIALTLREFGEERFARRIARALVEARDEQAITTTARLAQIVSAANPRWEKHKHPATRAFQAIRMRVNRELEDLQALLDSALSLLAVGGRLVVISFHSLEDRLVKRYMREMARGPDLPRGLPIPDAAIHRPMKLVGRAQRATAEEVAANPRARSAIMRVAEKAG